MKNLFIIIFATFFFLFFSCKDDRAVNSITGTEICIDMSSSKKIDMNTIIEKIELIPLETNDSSLIGNLNNILYIKDRYFMTFDRRFRIIVFDQEGNYVSNSKNAEGQGPNLYHIGLSMAYNYFTGNIEVITPEQTILSYDVQFNFVKKETINSEEEVIFYKIFPINEDQCILIPAITGQEPNVLFFYDRKKNKMIKKLPYDHVLAKLTQSDVPIRYWDSGFYFTPTSLSYLGYTIDCKNYNLNPEFRLNFGENNIYKNQLQKFDSDKAVNDYLAFDSPYPLPLQNIFNDLYIMSLIRMKNEYHMFIQSREMGSEILFSTQLNGGLQMPEFFTIDKHILFALIQPYSIEKNIDVSLLDEKGKRLLKTISEDDNPIVVKYYLKR